MSTHPTPASIFPRPAGSDAEDPASYYDTRTGGITCRCMICGRCGHHTGNATQGHWWAYCRVTLTTREHHFCCPGDCELEAAAKAASEAHLPRRIQLSRRSGWRKPEDAIVVSRPSQWGNPYRIRQVGTRFYVDGPGVKLAATGGTMRPARIVATEAFRVWVNDDEQAQLRVDARLMLAGHDLACWCPLGEDDGPCHGDVWLELLATPADGGAL